MLVCIDMNDVKESQWQISECSKLQSLPAEWEKDVSFMVEKRTTGIMTWTEDADPRERQCE